MSELKNILTYDNVVEEAITVVDDAYQETAQLLTPSRVAGSYKLTLSMIHTLNSTTTAAYFGFSLDGGLSWVEVKREPKDVTDKDIRSFARTIEHLGGILDLRTRAKKESAGDVLIINRVELILERKLRES